MLPLIGITGKAGAGKSTAAEYICKKYYPSDDFVDNQLVWSFADNLKEAIRIIFQLDYDAFDRDKKEHKIPAWEKTPRELAQIVGTDLFRNMFRSDIWIRSLEQTMLRYGETSGVVCDVRFDDEAEWVISKGGYIIEVIRPGLEFVGIEGHKSEAGISDEIKRFVVQNDSTIEELEFKLDAIMTHIKYEVENGGGL